MATNTVEDEPASPVNKNKEINHVSEKEPLQKGQQQLPFQKGKKKKRSKVCACVDFYFFKYCISTGMHASYNDFKYSRVTYHTLT